MSVKQIVDGDLARGKSFLRVSGPDEIAQGVDSRLQKLVGEDPWNIPDGTDWFALLKKGVPPALLIGAVTRRILSQPGLLTVETIDLTNDVDRGASVDWTGTSSTDQLAAVLRVQGKTEINT